MTRLAVGSDPVLTQQIDLVVELGSSTQHGWRILVRSGSTGLSDDATESLEWTGLRPGHRLVGLNIAPAALEQSPIALAHVGYNLVIATKPAPDLDPEAAIQPADALVSSSRRKEV